MERKKVSEKQTRTFLELKELDFSHLKGPPGIEHGE